MQALVLVPSQIFVAVHTSGGINYLILEILGVFAGKGLSHEQNTTHSPTRHDTPAVAPVTGGQEAKERERLRPQAKSLRARHAAKSERCASRTPISAPYERHDRSQFPYTLMQHACLPHPRTNVPLARHSPLQRVPYSRALSFASPEAFVTLVKANSVKEGLYDTRRSIFREYYA